MLVASVKQALEAAADEAARCGFVPRILTTAMSGEARRTAAQLVAEARRAQAGLRPGDAPLCLLAGGETTVTIRGAARGAIRKWRSPPRWNWRTTAASTSFAWGPTARTAPRTRRAATPSAAIWHGCAIGLHPKESLDANDSYPLLLKAGTLLRTGPTRTNVMDMAIMLVRPK